jgi:hypothetical protein
MLVTEGRRVARDFVPVRQDESTFHIILDTRTPDGEEDVAVPGTEDASIRLGPLTLSEYRPELLLLATPTEKADRSVIVGPDDDSVESGA